MEIRVDNARKLTFRRCGTAILAALSKPFTVAAFDGGASDIFLSYAHGESFESIKRRLLIDFPNSFDDIERDINSVQSFFCLEEYNADSHVNDDGYGINSIVSFARTRKILTSATLELTTRCNLRCGHCFHDNYTTKGFSKDDFEKVILDAKDMGVLFLCLTGGEIFLLPYINDAIYFADSEGFVIELKTNGTNISDHTVNVIAKSRIFDVQISVYSIDDGVNSFTQGFYKYSHVRNSILNLRDAGVPVSVSFPVGPHNVDDIDRCYEELSSLDVPFFFPYYITPNLGSPTRNSEYRLDYMTLANKLYPKLKRWGKVEEPTPYRSKDCGPVCWAGYEQVFISSDRVVYPCADLRVPLGNLSTAPFKNIISNRFSVMSGFMPTSVPVCHSCPYHDYCDSCIGIALAENGSFEKPSYHKCDTVRVQFESERR